MTRYRSSLFIKHLLEGFLGDFDFAYHLHFLFSLFLLFEEFALASDISCADDFTVFDEHVFAEGCDALAGDNLALKLSLDLHLVLLAGDEITEPFAELICFFLRTLRYYDLRKLLDWIGV